MRAAAPGQLDGGCDARYGRHECLWGRAPDGLAHALGARLELPGATVLDAGCGEGRNAVYLAARGAVVDAVDVSALAIAHGRREFGHLPGLTWMRGDVRTLTLRHAPFDGVLACSLLHWLDGQAGVAAALERFRAVTRPGGVNAVMVFNDRVPYEPPAGETHLPTLLPHAWYVDRYSDWDVVEASDEDETGSHAGHLEPHTHAVTRLIAVRP
jgi:tellurite methyltransferase